MDRDNLRDVVDLALEDWAEWMRQPEGPAGYPGRAAGVLTPSWIKSSEDLYDAVDSEKVEAIDASIDSLTSLSRLAINDRFGLGAAVWHFNERNQLYEKAKAELLPLLRKRGVV